MWYFSTGENDFVMKQDKYKSFVGKWRQLENMLLSEMNQPYTCKHHAASLMR